jgi:hypothetical protein
MGLRGLDRSGVGEFALPDLPLSIVDENPNADEKKNKNDDDSLSQAAPPRDMMDRLIPLFCRKGKDYPAASCDRAAPMTGLAREGPAWVGGGRGLLRVRVQMPPESVTGSF